MTAQTLPRLIDFHSHYYDASWYPSPQGPSTLSQSWPLLTDIQAQLAVMDEAGIDAKVLSAPSATILRPSEPCSPDLVKRINDRFAGLVATYPDRLLALATIDAFQTERAAREVERAIQDLGMGGICIDCARADRYLNAPEARPVLEVAAALGIVVFVHPTSPLGLTEHLAQLGRMGIFVARGTETAASVLAMLRSGLFDQLPNLRVVIPMIAAAAFWFERAVWDLLVYLSPNFLAYGMSFLTLGMFWIGQQTQLDRFARSDRTLTWIHLAFLLAVSFMPFSTGLLAVSITSRLALVVYWLNLLLLGIPLFGSVRYAQRAGLVKEEKATELRYERRILIALALYTFAVVLCVVSTYVSIALLILVQCYYAVAPRIRLLDHL